MQSRHENGTGGVGIGGGGKGDGSDGADGDVDAADGTQPERVWLVHRGGFTAALRLPRHQQLQQEEHKVSVRLLHNGEQLTVDEDDIEKQNSPALDLAEDICELKYLNEASVLHCLRQRYASNLIHTKAGPTLLVVNPMAPLSLYSEKVRQEETETESVWSGFGLAWLGLYWFRAFDFDLFRSVSGYLSRCLVVCLYP